MIVEAKPPIHLDTAEQIEALLDAAAELDRDPGHLCCEREAIVATLIGVEFLVASLSSIVGFKRLTDRPRDRNDLIGLAEVHGDLPDEPIPGLDD